MRKKTHSAHKLLYMLFAALLLTAGCGAPATPPPPGPFSEELSGQWALFADAQGMPLQFSLSDDGKATANDDNGSWRADDASLWLTVGGREQQYDYTSSGYMLTLNDPATGTGAYYVNPQKFSSGADKNADFKGKWAAWSTFAFQEFDGQQSLDSITYSTAGRSDSKVSYAARDGILMSSDGAGGYTFNLYTFSTEGALLLAETSEYDKENRQYTVYRKRTDPPAGLLADWANLVDTGGGALPAALTLGASGVASTGPAAAKLSWECYGEFVVLYYSDTDMQYAWFTQSGAALYLGNPDSDQAWYANLKRFQPQTGSPAALLGTWKTEDGKTELDFTAGSVIATNAQGTATVLDTAEQDGILKLNNSQGTYYMAYTLEDNTMKLYYGQLPFLDAAEMPLNLIRQ